MYFGSVSGMGSCLGSCLGGGLVRVSGFMIGLYSIYVRFIVDFLVRICFGPGSFLIHIFIIESLSIYMVKKLRIYFRKLI